MELKLNITKMHFWILLIAIALLGAGIFVYAQAGGNTQGHIASQVLVCTDTVSALTAGTATASCPIDYPIPLRGGCSSNCAWLARNYIEGNTQTCVVITGIDPYCTGSNQRSVIARITCCK
jgi:hypothetical protein